MRSITLLSLTAAVGLLLPRAGAADRYRVDPAHTSVAFSVRHMGISHVKGHFDEFTGTIGLDQGGIREADGTIQVKSINTGIEQRDQHLRSPDFFDAARYPVISFKTKRVEQDDGKTILIADFTLRGVTRELRLPVTRSGPVKDPQGKNRIGIEARATLNRRDYGLNFSGALQSGALLVGDEVTIEINAEATQL
jgi:polyisoprenoid-binding protein YceI